MYHNYCCFTSNLSEIKRFKMLGLYLNTLIICHKCCSMLSLLYESTLQKELPHFMTNNVFGQKSKNTITTKQT